MPSADLKSAIDDSFEGDSAPTTPRHCGKVAATAPDPGPGPLQRGSLLHRLSRATLPPEKKKGKETVFQETSTTEPSGSNNIATTTRHSKLSTAARTNETRSVATTSSISTDGIGAQMTDSVSGYGSSGGSSDDPFVAQAPPMVGVFAPVWMPTPTAYYHRTTCSCPNMMQGQDWVYSPAMDTESETSEDVNSKLRNLSITSSEHEPSANAAGSNASTSKTAKQAGRQSRTVRKRLRHTDKKDFALEQTDKSKIPPTKESERRSASHHHTRVQSGDGKSHSSSPTGKSERRTASYHHATIRNSESQCHGTSSKKPAHTSSHHYGVKSIENDVAAASRYLYEKGNKHCSRSTSECTSPAKPSVHSVISPAKARVTAVAAWETCDPNRLAFGKHGDFGGSQRTGSVDVKTISGFTKNCTMQTPPSSMCTVTSPRKSAVSHAKSRSPSQTTTFSSTHTPRKRIGVLPPAPNEQYGEGTYSRSVGVTSLAKCKSHASSRSITISLPEGTDPSLITTPRQSKHSKSLSKTSGSNVSFDSPAKSNETAHYNSKTTSSSREKPSPEHRSGSHPSPGKSTRSPQLISGNSKTPEKKHRSVSYNSPSKSSCSYITTVPEDQSVATYISSPKSHRKTTLPESVTTPKRNQPSTVSDTPSCHTKRSPSKTLPGHFPEPEPAKSILDVETISGFTNGCKMSSIGSGSVGAVLEGDNARWESCDPDVLAFGKGKRRAVESGTTDSTRSEMTVKEEERFEQGRGRVHLRMPWDRSYGSREG